MSLTERQIAKAIATPTLLGKHVAPRLLGRPYNVYPWAAYMEQRMLAAMFKPGRRIFIVSVGSQEGKTTFTGMLLPGWYLGHNPHDQVIFISYNEKQASKWGGRTKRLLQQYGNDLFGVGVDPNSTAETDWSMSNGFGGMMSAGIFGGITGNPGHLIIIDDLIKTREEANSPPRKGKIIDEWDDSITSRFQENTKVIITATRWAEDDLSGHLIEKSKEPGYQGTPVEILNFKALAEPEPEELEQMSDDELAEWTDFLGRHHGEALTGQHSHSFFLEQRANNEESFQTMRQGDPVVRSGGMFPIDAWSYWSSLPPMTSTVRVWDLAASEGKKADWTVGVKMGRDEQGRFYVIDRVRFRKTADEVQIEVAKVAKEDGFSIPIKIEEERAGAGKSVIAIYKKMLIGHQVDGIRAEGDKTSRATGYSAEQRKGSVYLPGGAAWLKEWRDEHVQMDGQGRLPRHDDQIDTAAYAFNVLYTAGGAAIWDSSSLGRQEGLTEEEIIEDWAIARALGL